MLKRSLFLFVVHLCLLGGYLYFYPRLSSTQDKEARKLVVALHSSNESVSEDAITKLQKMGVAVVPYLVEVLANDTSVTARRSASVVFMFEPTFTQRAIPTLIKAFEDSDPIVREHAVRAFSVTGVGAVGKAALPALIRAFKSDEDKNVRRQAASALRCVGDGDKDTVQALVDALKTEKDDGVRYSIADALMVPGRDISIAKIAVPALIEVLLKEEKGGIRQTAMNSIAWYFEHGRSAVPALGFVKV